MFLKNLEIFGFKSFADRTRISFSNGITALLGPNGCGKSNVVDAVKWVLGEQGARNMRAEKMEDVIFNGTESRRALNVAEVSLTIANENGLLPLDASEIMIKRRLFRSGESEYYINGAQVKLKDIRELFWDTGVGKAAYSVMEQGKIDQILSSKPEDRRYLFEEAAGITRFKVKRAEAERKLERMEENRRQVEVILSEVRRSYDTLKIQADKALRYRRLKEDAFEFERDIQLLRLRGFIQERDRRASEAERAAAERGRVGAEIEELSGLLSQNMDRVNEMQTRLAGMENELLRMAAEQAGKINLSRQLAAQQKDVKAKLSQLEGRKASLEERIETLEEEIGEQESNLRDKKRRIDGVVQNIESFSAQIAAASGRITDNDRRAAECERRITESETERAGLQEQLESITEHIVTELDQKLRDAGYSAAAHRAAREKTAHTLERLRILLAGRRDILGDFSAAEAPSGDTVRRMAERAAAAFDEAAAILAELNEAFAEYEAAVPQFIDEFLAPEGIITKKRAIDGDIREKLSAEHALRAEIQELKTENTGLVSKIDEYRATLEQLRIQQAEMKTQVQSVEEQIRLLRRDLASQENALRETESELYAEQKRYDDFNEQVLELEGEIALIERKGRQLDAAIQEVKESISAHSDDVSGGQEKLKKKQEEMQAFQAQLEKANLQLATAETEIKNLKENFRETHSRDLMEFEERMYAITESPAVIRDKLAASRQALRELGSVNLTAPDEFEEVKERFEFLSAQFADLQKARDDLAQITEEMRAEATELFLATYNKIKKNFHNMFRRLFGGGKAELRLIDPQNVLESGIDIFAQPPGKKLENIALLSGGEKTMTAVALLFATYMVRPSPFCLLDEIDAALDDQNVTRFVQTLREFANVSQYIVITHNKKTVVGAGSMLGVTMEDSGISKVITMRLENEDASGAASLPEPEPFEEEDVEEEQGVYIPPHPLRNKNNAEKLETKASDTATIAAETALQTEHTNAEDNAAHGDI